MGELGQAVIVFMYWLGSAFGFSDHKDPRDLIHSEIEEMERKPALYESLNEDHWLICCDSSNHFYKKVTDHLYHVEEFVTVDREKFIREKYCHLRPVANRPIPDIAQCYRYRMLFLDRPDNGSMYGRE